MRQLFLDSETYSDVPISFGLDRYFSEAKPLIVTYAFDDDPVQCWDVTANAAVPDDLDAGLTDEDVQIIAHNDQFDRQVLKLLGYDTKIKRHFCTMACAYAHALPGALEALGPVLGLPADQLKLAAGKKLIQLLCVPHKGKQYDSKSHPAEWVAFLDYGTQDITALREVYKRLPKHNYVGVHHDIWVLDQEINERGFQVDLELCKSALVIRDAMREYLEREVTELTGGVITKGTQRERILHHMIGEYGFFMLDMTADTIKKVLEEDATLAPEARRLLELRRDSSLTSLTKYERALERAGADGRIRYSLQFSGAGRTGRWAGRGVQPHNMPRPKREAEEIENVIIPAILNNTLSFVVDDVNKACQDALRGMIIAAEGCELLVGDWANIEGRILAWLANERWKLNAFAANDAGTGPDLYKLLYAQSFNISVDDVTSKQRQMGKVEELGCGYGGGVGAFIQFAKTYSMDLDELGRIVPGLVSAQVYGKADKAWERAFVQGEDFGLERDVYIACDSLKQSWRANNPNIVQMWWDMERAVKWAIDRLGSVQQIAHCKIWCTDRWLIIELPSGRRLLYAQPEIRTTVDYDEDTGKTTERSVIRYMAANAKQWTRERTYGGKLVENITQAIANDVLRASMLRAQTEGYPQILHVHDEQVVEAPIGLFGLNDLLALMEEPLSWAQGLPLKATGYVAQRYKKE